MLCVRLAFARRGSGVKTHRTLLPIAAATFVLTLGAKAPNAEETSSNLSPQALQEIAQVEAEIDRIEAQTLDRLAAPPGNQTQQVELLGKLMLYDKNLSVYRNEACAFCLTSRRKQPGGRALNMKCDFQRDTNWTPSFVRPLTI